MVIDERLATLRLHGMHRTWLALVETRQHLDLSLSDGIELLLQAEDDDREVRRSERLASGRLKRRRQLRFAPSSFSTPPRPETPAPTVPWRAVSSSSPRAT